MARKSTASLKGAKHLLHHKYEEDAYYRGTRAELIAVGLANAGDFPGDPSGPATSRSWETGGRKFVLTVHSRMAKPMTYWVRVTLTNAERRARWLTKEAQRPGFAEACELERSIRDAIRRGEYLPLSRCEPNLLATVWTGTREELLSTGVCEQRHFPTGNKQVACCNLQADQFEQRRDGLYRYWTTRWIARDYFEHSVWWDDVTVASRRRNGVVQKQEVGQPRHDRITDPSFRRFLQAAITPPKGLRGAAQ